MFSVVDVQAFVSELDTFFAKSPDTKSNILPNPYYWCVCSFLRARAVNGRPGGASWVGERRWRAVSRSGNEEDLHAVFGFLYANRPDLTQKYACWVFLPIVLVWSCGGRALSFLFACSSVNICPFALL